MSPVMLLVNSRVRGGVEEVVVALAKGLASRNYETHLAAPAPLLESWRAELAGQRVRQVAVELGGLRRAGEFGRLARYLREHRIRLLNTHLFRSTLFAAPIARAAGVPVIIETAHGPEAWRRGWLKRSGVVDRLIERLVTANIAVSEANRRYLIEQKRYPPEKIHVIPNGRDLSRFASVTTAQVAAVRARVDAQPEDRLLLAVGRLEPQKDPLTLLDAFARVAQSFPAAKLVLAGE
ncbi:MAG: glycosyltransferase family 4 protein, partial [Bryobacteraceae bacterium]